MPSNNKAPAAAPFLKWFFRIPTALLWIAIALLILPAATSWLLVPYVLGPWLDRQVAIHAARGSQHIGEPVGIFYDGISLSFGLDSIYVKVSYPHLEIGTGEAKSSFEAASAGLILRIGAQPPEIFIEGTKLAIAQDREGRIAIADAAVGNGTPADLAGLLESGGLLPPIAVVLRNTELTFLRPDDEGIVFEGLDISAYPVHETASYVLAMRNQELAIRADVERDSEGQLQARWYLQDTQAHRLLQLLNLPARASSARVQAWGTYRNSTLRATLTGSAFDLQTGWAQPATVSLASADFAAEAEWLPEAGSLLAQWRLDARGLLAHTSPSILGATLLLERAAGFGAARANDGSWQLDANDLRISHRDSMAAANLKLASGPEGMSISLAARAPEAELAWAAELLPDDLGDASLAVLREDLSVGSARMSTLVVHGNPDDFPWRDGDGGTFLLEMDFAQATLDYLPDYPPVTDASGNLRIDGARLRVTVDSAKLAGVPAGPTFAAIDDLEIIPGTLFIASQASFEGSELRKLLNALPPVAAQFEQHPQLAFSGSQQTEVRLDIPLDTDDPVAINGKLDLHDTRLVWEGLQASVEQAQGTLSYSSGGFSGILRGQLLDAPVRLSVQIAADSAPAVEIAGNFDLTQALASLSLATVSLPLAGASPYVMRFDGKNIALSSSLQGATVDLPPPLGKLAHERKPLEARISQQPLPLTVHYGDGLMQATIGEQGADVLIGEGAQLEPAPFSGYRIAVNLPRISIDDWLAWIAASGLSGPAAAITATVAAAQAELLDYAHADIGLALQVDSNSTVIFVESDVVAADLEQQGQTLAITLHRLDLPFPDEPSPPADAVITVAPGKPTGRLPTLRADAHNVRLGEIMLPTVLIAGQPRGERWMLSEAIIPLASGTISLGGDTMMASPPQSRITLAIASHDMQAMFGVFGVFGFGDEDSNGAATVAGTLAWAGELSRVHYPSLSGTLALTASSFRMDQLEGEGAKLMRLLSPFALLTLGFLELGAKGLEFESASGSIELAEGKAIFRDLRLKGEDVSLLLSGSTNLITERHDLLAEATVHNSNQVFTAGAALLANPLLGSLLFIFDNILDKPIIKPLSIEYAITGTWDEPKVENLSQPAPIEQGN